ncbi:hypothetical protein [Luethyella okanaganae]|uniref:Uncharacterized protein n=1 Tax=Luethyella okanaganae TaxID=69372 RepID=A0ABW1VGF3_9MICO
MFAFLVVLGIIAAAAIIGGLMLVARDGYGRVPERSFVRIF